MRKSKIILAMVITVAIGMGATAYASSSDATQSGAQGQRLGLGRITGMRGFDYFSNILKNKLGISESEITNAANAGKTPYDIAIEKGMTQDQIKASLLEERTKAIDAAIEKGTITKEEGSTIKDRLNTNIQNCPGNFGQGQGRGQGRGMMGNGQCGFNQ